MCSDLFQSREFAITFSAVNSGERGESRGINTPRVGGMPHPGVFLVNCLQEQSRPLAGGMLTASLQVPLIEEAMGGLFWG